MLTIILDIFHLMKMDPYPRFLKSEAYSQLLAFRPDKDGAYLLCLKSRILLPFFEFISKERHPLEEMVSEGFLQAAERQDGWEETREQDGVIISRKRFV